MSTMNIPLNVNYECMYFAKIKIKKEKDDK